MKLASIQYRGQTIKVNPTGLTCIPTCKICKDPIPDGIDGAVLEKLTFHLHHKECLPKEKRANKARAMALIRRNQAEK